ncbi:MAG TPA: DEAD/DEAH box helicase [Pyrinomonadaceae bacterium]|nr:DEAD/DEAH box helicase [Pyrinomonadaceae bacterium]
MVELSQDQTDLLLLPPQSEVVGSGLLDSGFNSILHMPTGSGKTWLAEQSILQTLQQGARAVYLTPLRALAAELYERWQKEFVGFVTGVFTGDQTASGKTFPVPFRDAQLLVMTPERLDACTRMWRSHWSWIPEVDLIVVDELHLLAESPRGARLEGAISRMRRLNPFARFICLSATLGNTGELADWLDAVLYTSNWRPIPLTWRFVRYRKAAEKPQLLAEEVRRNVNAGGKSLVFVQSRRRAESLSRELQSQGLRASHHHAGLTHETRRAIEDEFRQHKRDVIVATSTLEMGLNLPVRQVVLYDIQTFDGNDFKQLSTNSVWQRVGRAGRRNLDTEGEAVLLVPTWDKTAESYTLGRFEPICSTLSNPRTLAEQLLAEVTSGLSRTSAQLEFVFQLSLAAKQKTLPSIANIIDEMCRAGMLDESKEGQDELLGTSSPLLRATRLGRIASRQLLAPATITLFLRALEHHPQMTFLDLLLTCASSPDCEPVLPVDFEELDELAASLAKERSFLLQNSRSEVARLLGVDGKRLLAALKMALVARAWTRCADTDLVAEQHDCYPFEVARLRESIARLLVAMNAIFGKPEGEAEDEEALPLADASQHERVGALHAMIVAGLDDLAVTLTLVPGIGPKLAKRLQNNGIADIKELAQATDSQTSSLIGIRPDRAGRWVKEARKQVHARSTSLYRETAPTVSVSPPDWPPEVDPYRLRRALDLTIQGTDGGTMLVIGGLEPHLVSINTETNSLICDCIDSSRGNICKHQLAVRLGRGEVTLERLAQALRRAPSKNTINIFELWFDTNTNTQARRAS